MTEYFNIKKIKYEGPGSTNDFAFKFYDPEKVVFGKKMKEHLPFAMAWWHSLGAAGKDIFGDDTADKSFGAAEKKTMEHARAKADAGFEMMEKLGIGYFCFHDLDLAPEAGDIKETNRRLDEISEYILEKMQATGIKCLWGTANLFNHPRYMNGAASSNSADVFCFAAAQVKKALDLTVRFGGRGYVFWGGREGYDTLLNTDMKFELDNIATLMGMAVEYGRKIGFKGDFYIEPKPKEPTKHQYDYDAATSIEFLRKYGLDKDFKLNIEANHATLAGHTFQHDLRVAAINGMLGSIDANQGDLLLGWDTDQFPSNVYDTTLCMYEVLKAGGITGGFNFDAKDRRASYTDEDMFLGFILGMDAFALGLLNAAKMIEDGRIDAFVRERYSSYEIGVGADIVGKNATLEKLAAYAEALGAPDLPGSGRQEKLEAVLNSLMFGLR
jgi:xylose isomerase